MNRSSQSGKAQRISICSSSGWRTAAHPGRQDLQEQPSRQAGTRGPAGRRREPVVRTGLLSQSVRQLSQARNTRSLARPREDGCTSTSIGPRCASRTLQKARQHTAKVKKPRPLAPCRREPNREQRQDAQGSSAQLRPQRSLTRASWYRGLPASKRNRTLTQAARAGDTAHTDRSGRSPAPYGTTNGSHSVLTIFQKLRVSSDSTSASISSVMEVSSGMMDLSAQKDALNASTDALYLSNVTGGA